MLSIAILHDPGAVVAYFAADNYYAKDDPQAQENSQWFGRGAKELGLSGTVTKEEFIRLLEGHVGNTRLGRQGKDQWDHTPGWDLTFSAPKSYSIINQNSNNKTFADAHDKAVMAAMRFVEDHAAYVRLTKDGKTRKVLINNLTVAMFRHDTSRALDPNDHTHCVVANAVKTEHGWRSLDSKTMFELKLESGEFYRRQLARELHLLGFEIEVTREKDFLFEIKGVPKELIEHHSKRRQAILEQLNDLDLDSAKAAAIAALDTRDRKLDPDRAELRKEWQEISRQFGFSPEELFDSAERAKKEMARNNRNADPVQKSIEAVEHAIAVLAEREAAFEKKRLILECSSSNLHQASYEEITAGITRKIESGDLIAIGDDTVDLFTTKKGQELEQLAIGYLHQGFEKMPPIRKDVDLKALFPKIDFSPGQADSLKLILETRDQFIGVQGYAGTGKTFALKSATIIAERAGYEVKGMASSSSAAQILGVDIERPTQNIAQHMADYYKQKREAQGASIDHSKQLWIVDESSLASTKDINGIMAAALDTGARVAFVGDKAQKDSVEAGRTFYQLQAAGMDTASVTEIQRQKDLDLRKAVYSLVSLVGMNDLKSIEQTFDRDVSAAKREYREFCDTIKPLVPGHIHNGLTEIAARLDQVQTPKERNALLKSAMDVVADDVSKALNNIAGRIEEYINNDQRENALVNDYINLSKEDRANTILVVPSNEGRGRINDKLRANFVSEGTLRGKELKVNALVNRGLEAERLRHTYAYRNNDIIRFGRDFRKGKKLHIGAGEYFRVIGRKDGELELQKIATLDDKNERKITWKPKKTMRERSVELFEEKERGLREGERIRWRKNLKTAGIMNGEELTITKIRNSAIETKNRDGKTGSFDLSEIKFRHLDYAYTHTVDTAQGATYSRVMAMVESFRKNLINQKAFYVIISRAKEYAHLYTDNAKKLFEAILERHGANTVAIDAKEYSIAIERHVKTSREKGLEVAMGQFL